MSAAAEGRPARVLIVTIGTRGDVQPFIYLAQALQRLYRKEQVCRPWLPAHAWCARNANVRMPGV